MFRVGISISGKSSTKCSSFHRKLVVWRVKKNRHDSSWGVLERRLGGSPAAWPPRTWQMLWWRRLPRNRGRRAKGEPGLGSLGSCMEWWLKGRVMRISWEDHENVTNNLWFGAENEGMMNCCGPRHVSEHDGMMNCWNTPNKYRNRPNKYRDNDY